MELIEKIREIELNDKNKWALEDINEKYCNYINQISQFDDKLLNNYLNTIKNAEILNNQQSEIESSLIISLYKNMHKENSIDKIIKLLLEQDNLTKEDLQDLHKTLMAGTTSEANGYNFRSDNDKFVGTINPDGSKRIDYIPVDYKEIPENMDKALDFLNNNVDNVFINPIIFHGVIAAMQPFDDGNTRLSRLVQHAKIWKNTNYLYTKDFKSPLLYLSKNYLITRGKYRKLINNLAIEQNNEAWNQWINYNLNMVDEQLYYLDNSISLIKKRF